MTISSDVTTVNACEDKSEWTGVTHSNPDDNTQFSSTPVFREGNQCMAASAAAGNNGYWWENTAFDLTGEVLVFWVWFTGPFETGNLDDASIIIADGAGITGTVGRWDILTRLNETQVGGWFPAVVWPTQPTEGSAPTVNSIDSVGLEANNQGANDIQLVGWDYVHRMSKIIVSAQTVTMEQIASQDITDDLGVFVQNGTSFTCAVKLELGAAATTTTWDEQSKTLQFTEANSDHEIGFIFVDPTTGALNFTCGDLVGGNPVDGLTISWTNGARGAVFTDPNNCDIFKLYDSTFIGGGDAALPTGTVDREVLGCKWSDMGEISVSSCQFEGNTIVNAFDRGILVPSTGRADKNNSYIACVHAQRYDTAGSYTIDGDSFSGNTYDIENSAEAATADSYTEGNQNATQQLGNGTIVGVAQSFTNGTLGDLSNARFYLSKTGTPTGNATAVLYAINNAIGGGDDIPTGVALATSDPVDVADLTGTLTLTQFQFSDEFEMSASTDYVIALEYSGGDGSNYVNVGTDTSTPTATGNFSTLTGSTWSAVSGTDGIFYVSRGGIVILNVSNGANPATFENTGTIPGATIINNVVSLTLANLRDNTEVRVYAEGTTTELAGVENATDGTSDDRSVTFALDAAIQVDIRFAHGQAADGNHYLVPPADAILDFTWPSNTTTIPITQVIDRTFDNPA